MASGTSARYPLGGIRAWMVWSVALAVYVLAIFHRSSLGVAGLLAEQRFDITNSQLAAFTVLQLAVYAAMQVPVGVLLDRFGPKALVISGAALMTLGQFAFAFAESFPTALISRGVLGAGDAMLFTSVIRLAAVWFKARQVPLVVQLTGLTGQLGAVAASAPLTVLLREFGWTRTFAVAASVGLVLLVAVVVVVRDAPFRETEATPVNLRVLARSMRGIWRSPGTQLGLWAHFTSQFAVNCFALLWGFPFLVEGQGLSEDAASAVLLTMLASVFVIGLVLARAISRHPYYRSLLVLGVVAAIAGVWTIVLLWPGPAPLWLLVVLAIVVASGGPASMVSFDLARTFTSLPAAGRANGVINAGGFVATLLAMGLMGLVLDLRAADGDTTRSLADYKVAMSVQYLFWIGGGVQLIRWRRRARAALQEADPEALRRMRRGEQVNAPFV